MAYSSCTQLLIGWGTGGGRSRSPETATAIVDIQSAAAQRLANVRRATWVAYGVFVGLFLIVMVPVSGIRPLPEILGYLFAVAVMATLPALANIRPQGSRTVLGVSISLLLIAWIDVWVVEIYTARAEDDPLELLFLGLLVFVAFYFITVHRALRAFIIPVTILAVCSLAGLLAIDWLLTLGGACIGVQSPTKGGWAHTAIILASVAAYHAGVKVLDGIARRNERALISDISLSAAAGLVLVALLAAAEIEAYTAPNWRISAAALVWTALSFCAYEWTIGRCAQPSVKRSLLMLRVFSTNSATERLLDTVQSEWRYIGPVYQIGGPDLARVNVGMYEFAKFATGKLHDAFLFGTVDRAYLARRLAHGADHEGRFTVNAVFCLDSAWRTTVEQLMQISDVILLDVRRFNRERPGTAFEIGLLAQGGLLQRAVVIGDSNTDWHYFDALVHEAGGVTTDILKQQIGKQGTTTHCLATLMQIASKVSNLAGAPRP